MIDANIRIKYSQVYADNPNDKNCSDAQSTATTATLSGLFATRYSHVGVTHSILPLLKCVKIYILLLRIIKSGLSSKLVHSLSSLTVK